MHEIDKGEADFFDVRLKTKKLASEPRGISLKRKCYWLEKGYQSE